MITLAPNDFWFTDTILNSNITECLKNAIFFRSSRTVLNKSYLFDVKNSFSELYTRQIWIGDPELFEFEGVNPWPGGWGMREDCLQVLDPRLDCVRNRLRWCRQEPSPSACDSTCWNSTIQRSKVTHSSLITNFIITDLIQNLIINK